MALKTLTKSRRSHAPVGAVWLAVALACLLTGACVGSTEPVLGDARAILGERGQVHLFDAGEGSTSNPRVHGFQWNGRRYVVAGRAEMADFTVHPYEGRDLIVQGRTRRNLRPYSYAVARKLTEGVYAIIPIEEKDSDDAVRNRFCISAPGGACRIETPEQLFALARATAAKEQPGAMVAVIARPNPKPEPKRPPKRR
jgi:hypothetical protein